MNPFHLRVKDRNRALISRKSGAAITVGQRFQTYVMNLLRETLKIAVKDRVMFAMVI